MGLLKENREWHEYYDFLSDYDEYTVLRMLANGKNLWTPLIQPAMYQQALNEFTKTGTISKFPSKYIYQWIGIIMKNTAIIRSITSLAGHDMGYPTDMIIDACFNSQEEFEEYKKGLKSKGNFSPDFGWIGQEEVDFNEDDEPDDEDAACQYLEDHGYYDKMVLPDGSNAWSDYGVQPLETIIMQYDENLPAEQVLVLINKALDVTHQRGDLCSAFIDGGSSTLSRISNSGYINESKKMGKKMNTEYLKDYIKHLKPMFELIKSKFNIDVPYPKVVFNLKKQECDPILIKTGYFDPTTNKIHIFLCDDKGFRSVKDAMRSFCHECIHYFQQYNGTIEKSGYSGDKITEDNKLISLELEAYAKGNLYFREYTEKLQKK